MAVPVQRDLPHDACAAVARTADASWRGDAEAARKAGPNVIRQPVRAHLHGAFARILSVENVHARYGGSNPPSSAFQDGYLPPPDAR